jgi:hypothetical protein
MIPGSRSFRLYPSSLILAGALALANVPGHAIDEGVAKGDLVVNGRAIRLAHSYAHRHDNGERLLDGPELRILLSDREVSHTLLAGIRPARLTELARKGGVEGMLLTVDARKPLAGMRGVLLVAGKDPHTSLASFSSSGGGSIRKLAIGNNRVLGDVQHQSLGGSPAFEYSATFSAPLFREEPITERLAGTRAVQSAPFKAFALYHESLRAGEVETARRLATPDAFREVDALIARAGRAEAIRTVRNMTAVPGIRDKPQVFVRGRRALIVFQTNGVSEQGRGLGVQALARVGGQWLVAGETGVIREQTGRSWQK